MKDELHARLGDLATRIDKTRSELRTKQAWHDEHHLKAGKLEARYAFLQKDPNGETTGLEVHGHSVSNPERSVRQRIDGLEL